MSKQKHKKKNDLGIHSRLESATNIQFLPEDFFTLKNCSGKYIQLH